MKKLTTLFYSFIICTNFIYSQNWQWSNQVGGIYFDNYMTTISDKSDNIYVGGISQSSVIHLRNDSITGSGYRHHLITKYDINGNKLWTKNLHTDIGSIGDVGYINIIYDKYSDEILVSGEFKGTMNCDSLSIIGNSNWSTYIAKFDQSGNCKWLKLLFIYGKVIHGMDVDSLSNIYCFANLSSIYLYNSNNDTILPGGNFIKLDANGNILWKRNKVDNGGYGGSSSYNVYSLKINSDKIYLSGDMSNDTLIIDTIKINNSNSSGIVLSAFDMDANVLWAKVTANPNTGGGYSLGIDENNNLYTIGTLRSFENYFPPNDTIFVDFGPSVFILKFDTLGNFLWTKNIALTNFGDAGSYSSTTLANGNTYVTGYFDGTINLGNISATSSDSAMFITCYDSNGNCLGIKTFQEALGIGVATLSNGVPIVCGRFKGFVNIGSNSFTSYGDYDGFIGKLDAFTGITNLDKLRNNQLIIYANPNNGRCNVKIPDDLIHENNLVLQIFDNNERLIQQKTLQIQEGKIKVNLEEEAKGVYGVILSNGRISYTGKIIFE
jgi:hypothetical protein